jgi:hypothetical protein
MPGWRASGCCCRETRQAGEYLFRPGLAPEALGKVIRGDVVAHWVTVPRGSPSRRLPIAWSARLGDRDAFLAAMRDPAGT